MSAANPSDRALIAKLAANERWAREPNRIKATRPGTAGLLARFEREVDPDGALNPAERSRRAEGLRRAHMQRLALRSAQARRAQAGGAA